MKSKRCGVFSLDQVMNIFACFFSRLKHSTDLGLDLDPTYLASLFSVIRLRHQKNSTLTRFWSGSCGGPG
ncbi:hypothetical protein RRG08_008262 [Elysia crispata]|uniref:Uncharacterized protein n=1 Tax=Elysia crispata TaxID=231223 RepID=A0AAE0ZM68_9GAST|nr:hypothetical protein RRG08_008262 [Elysia crispata]